MIGGGYRAGRGLGGLMILGLMTAIPILARGARPVAKEIVKNLIRAGDALKDAVDKFAVEMQAVIDEAVAEARVPQPEVKVEETKTATRKRAPRKAAAKPTAKKPATKRTRKPKPTTEDSTG